MFDLILPYLRKELKSMLHHEVPRIHNRSNSLNLLDRRLFYLQRRSYYSFTSRHSNSCYPNKIYPQ